MYNLIYKIVLSTFMMCFYLSSFELKREYNNGKNMELFLPSKEEDLELIEDMSYEKDYHRISFNLKEPEKTTLTIELGHFEKPKPMQFFQKSWNIKTMLFPNFDKQYKNALQLMKDYRAFSQRNKLYSFWKLIDVKNENDIFFEKKTLGLGHHVQSHTMTRLIKQDSNFYVFSLTRFHSYFNKEDHQKVISYLSEIHNLIS